MMKRSRKLSELQTVTFIMYFAIQNMVKYSAYHHVKAQVKQSLSNRRKTMNLSE